MPLASRVATQSDPEPGKPPGRHDGEADAKPGRPIAALRASSMASAGRPPSQAPAASRCSMSEARCTSPAVPGVAPAWPIRATRTSRPAPAANCSRRVAGHAISTASSSASASRGGAHQSEAGVGQHRPDAAVQAHREHRRAVDVGGEPHQPGRCRTRSTTASAIQTTKVRRRRNASKPAGAAAPQAAGSATSTMKQTVPPTSTVAAKCTARIRISGSITPASACRQCRASGLNDRRGT